MEAPLEGGDETREVIYPESGQTDRRGSAAPPATVFAGVGVTDHMAAWNITRDDGRGG